MSIAFAIAGDISHNSRGLRQLRLLAEMDRAVTVYSFTPEEECPDLGPRIAFKFIPKPEARGPLFFRAITSSFRSALEHSDASIFHASDLYVLGALDAVRKPGTRLVFDSREMYPHVAATAGRPWVSLYWHWYQSRYLKKTDVTFTVNDSIADWLERTYDIPRPTVLYNVPPRKDQDRTSLLREGLPIESDTIILHQGQMREHRGCEVLVRSMVDVPHADLVFLGGGPVRDRLEALASDLGLERRVHFHPRVPTDELLMYTASADIGVTLLEDTCLNHRYALPNKFFEYLMSGLPVLGSDFPEIGGLIKKFGVGVVTDPADASVVSASLNELVNDPQKRRDCASNIPDLLETISWEIASDRMRQAYEQL